MQDGRQSHHTTGMIFEFLLVALRADKTKGECTEVGEYWENGKCSTTTCTNKYYIVEKATDPSKTVKVCTTTEACTKDHPFIKTTGDFECVATCSGKTYSDDGSKKTCETDCNGNHYLADTEIVSGETYFKCAAACANVDTDYTVTDNLKVYCYADSCPDSHPYLDGADSKQCKIACD